MRSSQIEDVSFSFGPFLFIPQQQILYGGSERLRIGSRAVDILYVLVSRAGDLVTKEELIAEAWPQTNVDDGNLKVHICSLRRAFGDTRKQASYITTVPGRGYRFVAPVLMTTAREATGPCSSDQSSSSPSPEPRIVGRDQEAAEIAAALSVARVVTLAGPLGIGKALLARSVAASLQPAFNAGVHIIDCAELDGHKAFPNFVAAAMGLRSTSVDMTAALIDYLEHRRVLVILDHCEHALDAARLFISRFLVSASPSAFLTVSLEPLRIPGEAVHRIGILGYPDQGNQAKLTCAEALSFPAVQMLVDRAQQLSGYELIEDDVDTIVALCQVMDGRPRSINGALLDLLGRVPLETMLALVTRRLSLGPQPGEPPAFQCLMSSKIDFGYGRLSLEEAKLLRLLSTFSGVFEMEDAVLMVAPSGWTEYQTFMVLSNLIAKSLIWVEPATTGVRYRILAAERFYLRARLREDGAECNGARAQHARVLLRTFEQAVRERAWIRPEAWRVRYQGRREDLTAAIEWAASKNADLNLRLQSTASAIQRLDEA